MNGISLILRPWIFSEFIGFAVRVVAARMLAAGAGEVARPPRCLGGQPGAAGTVAPSGHHGLAWPGHRPRCTRFNGGGPVTHRGEKPGAPPTAFPAPGAVSAAMRPRSSPAVPAAAARGPSRAEPAPLRLSSARPLPPCEISRPPCRAPGPPCRSAEDAAGKPPHPAGLLGAGDGQRR